MASFIACIIAIINKSMNGILVHQFIHNSFWEIMFRVFAHKTMTGYVAYFKP